MINSFWESVAVLCVSNVITLFLLAQVKRRLVICINILIFVLGAVSPNTSRSHEFFYAYFSSFLVMIILLSNFLVVAISSLNRSVSHHYDNLFLQFFFYI